MLSAETTQLSKLAKLLNCNMTGWRKGLSRSALYGVLVERSKMLEYERPSRERAAVGSLKK